MKTVNWIFAIASLLAPPFLAVWWFITETANGGGWYTFAFIIFVIPAVIGALIPGILVIITVAICRGNAKMLSYLIAAPIVWLITMVPPLALSDFGDGPNDSSPSLLHYLFGVPESVSWQIARVTMQIAFAGWIVLFALAIFLLIANCIRVSRERKASTAHLASPNGPYSGFPPPQNNLRQREIEARNPDQGQRQDR